MALLHPIVKKRRSLKLFTAFFDAVNVPSVSIIVAVCFEMGKEGHYRLVKVLIAVVSIVMAFGYKKSNSAFVVLDDSLNGYLPALI